MAGGDAPEPGFGIGLVAQGQGHGEMAVEGCLFGFVEGDSGAEFCRMGLPKLDRFLWVAPYQALQGIDEDRSCLGVGFQ